MKGIAFLWGFAEATFFFIVPDLWTSVAGRKDLKQGFIHCCTATLGAVIGGVVMYWWGKVDLLSATGIVEKIPAISPEMMKRVPAELEENGLIALFTGPLRVTPYKIYAINSASFSFSLFSFILVSAASRFIRFALVTTLCNQGLKLAQYLGIRTNPIYLLLGGWGLFYLAYFSLMPN